MRKLPTVLAFVFIVITLWRVGQFADARMVGGWPGWVFSIGIGAGVFIAAYFTRDSITIKDNGKEDRRSANVKSWAWGLLIFCVVGDGLFNLSEVWYTVNPKWDAGNWLIILATFVFGLFPTFAAAGFGALQGHVDRLPTPPANERTSILLALRKRAVRFLLPPVEPTKSQQIEQPAPVAVVPPPVVEQSHLFNCLCGYGTNDPKAWAGHKSAEARAGKSGKVLSSNGKVHETIKG